MRAAKAVGLLAAVMAVGACGGVGAGGSSVSPTIAAGSAAGSTTASSASPSPTVVASASPTAATTVVGIGRAADDGARIVDVQTIDTRTRDLTIDSPAVGSVNVRLLLPTAFESRPADRWPALYLLHGSSGSSVDWTTKTDVAKLTEPTDLLVVMPDGGDQGFYTDWWNNGNGGQPMWEKFHTVELPQLIERNWRASDKRAIAGLSMGGLGAMDYAARHPGMYQAAASYSGVVDPIGGEMDPTDWWGDRVAQADIWKAHDPVNLASGLKGTQLYVSFGDGTAGPLDSGVVPDGDPEGWLHDQNVTFVQRLKDLGIPVTVDAYGPGTHTWPYWERGLHRSLPLLLKALGE